MCYIDGQKNKYTVLNECNRMLKYNISLCYLRLDLPSSLFPSNASSKILYAFLFTSIRLEHLIPL
jgi:hypothetical protein